MALIHDTGHFGPLFLGSQSRVSLEDLKPSLVNLVQQACRSLGCYGTPQILTNQLNLSQPEGGRLCSSNYNWPPTPRIFKPSYSPVQNLLNVIYLSEPKVLTNIVANSGWPKKPGFKSEKKNVWRISKILFQRKLHNY